MAVPTAQDFVQELKDLIATSGQAHANYPLVQGIAAGTIPIRQLQGWITQDYQYRKHVTRLATLRYVKCTDPEIAAHLYEVVEEEAAGVSTGTAGHLDLFYGLAAGLGVSQQQLEAAPVLPPAAAHVYWAELILHTQPWFLAMAAQLAGEGDGARNNRVMRTGLQHHYGLDDEALRFYRTHEEADADHGSLTEVIIRRYVTTQELQAQATAIVRRKLQLLWDMWGSYQYF